MTTTATVIRISGEPTTYEYDMNGCLTKKTVPGGGETTYYYDFENRLISAENVVQGFSLAFTYDGDKRRTSRFIDFASQTTTTKFLYDGINILKDLDGNGAVKASYVQGIGIDKLISVSYTSSSEPSYYHSDALGSVRSLTDDTGTVQAAYAYDAWGSITEQTGTSDNEYKFTSRRWEEEIGLQYNRARFYDPEIGRFTTPDPLTGGPDDPTICYKSDIYSQFHRFIKEHVDSLQPDKQNRYVYCYNNPINLIDPLGLTADPIVIERVVDTVKVAAIVAVACIASQNPEAVERAIDSITATVTHGAEKVAEGIREAFEKVAPAEADPKQSDWTKHAESDAGEEIASSSEEVQPGEVQGKAKTEEASGQKGAEVEVEAEEATAEAAQTREVTDFDEKGQVRKRTETTYTETREPWTPPVDNPPPKYPITKALVDLAAEVLGNLLK